MKDCFFIIWDLDGVLYDYNTLPNRQFDSICDKVCAAVAKKLIPNLTAEKAIQLAYESYKKFGDCYGAFMPYANQSDLKPAEFRHRLFKDYHASLFDHLELHHPDFFSDKDNIADAFQKTKGYVKHGVASHSCMDGWGKPILKKMGILPFFDQPSMIGLDQYDFVRKFESTKALQMVLKQLNADPHRTFFVEDSLRNIEPATEITGLRCVYIHRGNPLSTPPSSLYGQFETPSAFLQYVETMPKAESASTFKRQIPCRETPINDPFTHKSL